MLHILRNRHTGGDREEKEVGDRGWVGKGSDELENCACLGNRGERCRERQDPRVYSPIVQSEKADVRPDPGFSLPSASVLDWLRDT